MANSLVSYNMLSAFLFVLLAGSAVFAQNTTSSAAVTVDSAITEASVDVDSGALVNKLVDAAFYVVQKALKAGGFDPLKHDPFEINLPGLGFLGKLELNDCELYNLSTIHRAADAEFKRVKWTLLIKSALGFGNLEVNCNYKVFLLKYEVKKGKAVVDIPELTAEAELDVNISTQKIDLKGLQLYNKGPIDVNLGGGIIDKILSFLAKILCNVIIYFISEGAKILEDIIRKILEGSNIDFDYDLLKTIPE